MEKNYHRCHACNCGPLAPGRFSYVLETDLQSRGTGWEKADLEGSSRVDLSGWLLRTQYGERRASMANFLCSASMSLSEPFRVGWNGRREILSQPNVGSPSFETTGK